MLVTPFRGEMQSNFLTPSCRAISYAPKTKGAVQNGPCLLSDDVQSGHQSHSKEWSVAVWKDTRTHQLRHLEHGWIASRRITGVGS